MFRYPILSEPIDMNVLLSSTTTTMQSTTTTNNEYPVVSAAAEGGNGESLLPVPLQQQPQDHHQQVRSVLVYPVFETFTPDAPIRGFLAALVPWEEYFENVFLVENDEQQQQQQQQHDAEEQQQQKLIPPVLVEMQEVACYNIQMTFIVQGSKARFVGNGLLHDQKYQSLGHTAPFATFTHKVPPSTMTTTTELPCLHDFRLTVYPTAALEEHYQTYTPALFTAMVLAVFAFTAVVFLLYDYLVGRRQNMILTTARKTTALVTSLFPVTVQDRIFEQQQKQEQPNSSKSNADNNSNNNNKKFTNSRYELQAFLGGNNTATPNGATTTTPMKDASLKTAGGGGGGGAGGGNASTGTTTTIARKLYNDQPIADLFPETTVFFCDIVGFTAWSSAREPTQVFVLLETVYGHFDDVAKRRKVFKIETVGDCYVAVTG